MSTMTRFRLNLRLRTLLAAIAVVALGLGADIALVRWAERRRQLPYELLRAAEIGDVSLIRSLLAEGADVDSVVDGRYPWTPLMQASFRGHTNAARLLLEHGADPDHEDLDCYRSVTLAAAEGHWDIVRLLVERGANATKGDGQSTTALGYAEAQGEEEMIRYLELKTPR
jgi:ankyrin repeat protein